MNEQTKNKIGVVYTCITGGYDKLYDHTFINPQWDYVCFADDLSIKDIGDTLWEIRPLVFAASDNIRNSRWHKVHSHILFPDYGKSIYVDANVNILNRGVFDDVDKVIKERIKLSLAPHPERDCLYDELTTCILLGKDNRETMEIQVDMIRKDGFPRKQGLFESNIIFREHHDANVIAVMTDWWWWILNYSRRDQLSLTYVLWKHNIKITSLSGMSYRYSDKIDITYGDQHITKEELILQRDRLLLKNAESLFRKIQKELNRFIRRIRGWMNHVK